MNDGAPGPDRYALMGHPVGHSWSPFIHGLFARATQQNIQYRLIDVPPERFRSEAVQFFLEGGRGLNVTIPHKRAAAELVNELSTRAERAQAVNTILPSADGELIGDNTDGIGLVTDLVQNLGITLIDKRVLLLGAGGATRGVLGPLLDRRPAVLAIANRTVARGSALAAAFKDRGVIVATGFDDVEAKPFDVIINATSASLSGAVPPLASVAVGAHTVCYDMAYAKGETPFTRWALQRGARAAYRGWGMLVEQAAESFFVWRGIRPETRAVLELLAASNR